MVRSSYHSFLGKLAEVLYVLLTLISIFFGISSQNISRSTGPIFTIFFHQMKGICAILIDPDLFFRFHKKRCYGNLFWAKLAKPSFNTLVFRNGFEYRNFDLQLLNSNIVATFCAKLIKIGPVTPEITMVITAPFWTRRKNRYISPNISASTGPILAKFSSLVEICMMLIKLT